MSKFLTTDRKRNLLSVSLGFIFIAVGLLMVSSSNFLIFIPGGLIVIFTYLFIPGTCCHDRHIIFKKGKYLNADKKNVSKKMPSTLVPHVLLCAVLSGILISKFNSLFVHILSHISEGSLLEKIILCIACTTLFTIPYILIHLYFFIKDLPVSTFFLYCNNGSGNNSYTHRSDGSISYPETSRSDVYNNPSYSSISGNIYNNR